MGIEWRDDLDAVDWDEASALYRAAPLGDKPAAHLRKVFSNSMFRCFAFVQRLLDASRGHRKVLLYAVPGKEPFYRRFGFLRMTTAMAIFDNQSLQLERGYLRED